MTTEMIDNIKKENNIQYFNDITYYAVPPNKNRYKIYILLAFNKDLFKTIICNISLITNENKETFIVLYNYFKNKYNFQPNKITSDYCPALISSIKITFPNTKIVPCFFHFLQNNIKKLPELRSKNNTLKKYAKDLLANIRLLCFIPLNNIESFYKNIKNKYRCKFPNYFRYLERNYINENSRYQKIWNYNELIYDNLNKDMLFYTNNICESLNRTLNKKYIGGCKTLYNFKNCLLDVINLYNNSKIYQEKNVSISRSLEHYVKTKLIFDLIKHEDLKLIKEEYKKYLLEIKYPIIEESYDSDVISNYEKKKPNFISDTSSSESQDNKINSSNENNSNNSDSSSDENNEQKEKNYEKNSGNISIKRKNNTKKNYPYNKKAGNKKEQKNENFIGIFKFNVDINTTFDRVVLHSNFRNS